MIVAFDIGGVISRYPEKMKEMMQALIQGGIDVRVVTDIPFEKAWRLLCLNGFDFLSKGQLHSGDWAIHGDICVSPSFVSVSGSTCSLMIGPTIVP